MTMAMTAEDAATPTPCLVSRTETSINDTFVQGVQKRGEPVPLAMTSEDAVTPTPCLVTGTETSINNPFIQGV